MMVRSTQLERDFEAIVAAAIAGDRCPQSRPMGKLGSSTVAELYRTGRIRSEVFRGNWRVVTILKGDHAGRSTAPSPEGGAPYLVNGVPVGRGRHAPRSRAAAAPVSLPRLGFLERKEPVGG